VGWAVRGALVAAGGVAAAWLAWAGASEWGAYNSRCHPTPRMPVERSQAIKREMMSKAGIPWEARGGYELDHVVPLCLGGSNSRSNLQLQTMVDARRKDRMEAAACHRICDEGIGSPAERAAAFLKMEGLR